MGKNDNTYEKRRREFEKKRKADEKRARRRDKKDGVVSHPSVHGLVEKSEPTGVDVEDSPTN